MCSSQHGSPWIVLGDFNVSRSVGESIGGCSRILGAMEEFNECLQASELDDLRFLGFLHTWCNKRSNGCISKKLDRVLVNNDWLVKCENSEAIFLPPSISDHCPSVVKLGLQGDIPVKNEAIHHFQNILGFSMPVRHGIGTLNNIIDNVISNDHADSMDRDVTNDEIREVCFSLHPNKAPGLDGFNAHFVKTTWDIVGEDVINAIQEFFRIKPCLPDIIIPSQSAFVAGRSIGDNILFVQELMRNYHKDIGCPRLSLKVDLMKAFDMVDRGFLFETLAAFHFPPKIITWIKACLTTPKFSISINGELAGFFSGKRGLRQGDPMSPYLFVIAMEVLSKILTKQIADSPSFKYHWKCDKIKLSHLCFADDLIMLCHGSYSTALVLKAALHEFSLLSGLLANQAKSNIFTSGLSSTTNQQLINLFGYTAGSLPICYLGIPIISTKLCLQDCSPLVDKVSGRLTSWMNRNLSYAHYIGNGSSTSLWFNSWHLDGPLLSKWSSRVVYDSGLPLNATINSIVLVDSWNWPAAMSIDLVEIKSRMPSYNPNSNIEDSIRWLPSPNGIYSTCSALASLRAPNPLVPWFKPVWFPQNILRMSFIL
ncbi:hypothetical protein Ddye_012766 [Dipteronia dyeriana]|uniref:Reverse transcriptase domain-containing protein n=1 Tax=Dipteronia dyeriana TaxID=168575 RepID=A0AAD9X519_9ROSI|nr:hypothetical protein Ddye_012766 [Dipteronia dyeriana]